MRKMFTMLTIVGSLLVTGCNRQPEQIAQQADQCMTAGNPQECAQVRDAGGDVSKYLIAGLGGYMLAKMMTPSGPRYYMQPDPHYSGTFHREPSYDRSYRYVRQPSYRPYSVVHHVSYANYPTRRLTGPATVTTTKRSIFGGTKTITKTYARPTALGASRPSYSAPVSYRTAKAASSWGGGIGRTSSSSSSYSRPSSFSSGSRSFSPSSSMRSGGRH
jgi:hypothetical protein